MKIDLRFLYQLPKTIIKHIRALGKLKHKIYFLFNRFTIYGGRLQRGDSFQAPDQSAGYVLVKGVVAV
jgi:hypothetical protein